MAPFICAYPGLLAKIAVRTVRSRSQACAILHKQCGSTSGDREIDGRKGRRANPFRRDTRLPSGPRRVYVEITTRRSDSNMSPAMMCR